MGPFFELQQHNVPQKITFFMKSHDYENENTVKMKNLEKVNFTVFTHTKISLEPKISDFLNS